jgi:hypothetical protein
MGGVKEMIDPNINPHEAACEELEKAEAEGARFACDEEIVVLADLHGSDKDDK